MTIRVKLIGTLMMLIFVSLIVGVLAFFGIYQLSIYITEISQKDVPATWVADSISVDLSVMRQYEKEFLLYSEIHDTEKQREFNRKIFDTFERLGKNLTNFKENFVAPDNEAKLNEIAETEKQLAVTAESFVKVSTLLLEGRTFNEVQREYAAYDKNVSDLLPQVEKVKQDILLEVENVSQKAAKVQKRLFMIVPAVSLVIIVIGMIVGIVVSNRITSSLNILMRGIRAMGKGNVNVTVDVKPGDELGQIAATFNDTMVKLREYIQTDEERKQTQENVIKFLEVVGIASDGDLTTKAPVTADVFGSLADAYNMMLDGLIDILFDVRKSAEMVGKTSHYMMEIFERMSEGSEIQMVEVKKASEAVDETSHATMQIGEKSETAQQVAVRMSEAANKGGRFVVQTIEGMHLIRVTVQAINKRMKTLAEKLLEIGSISNLIGDIAARTNLLAMNASIEAARAGEQGKGFVVIAEEIRTLADRATGGSKDIAGIIKAIQTEAGEVTSSLEEETKHVETQTKIATDTGLAFRDIDASVNESNKIISDIFNFSQEQREMTHKVVLAMEEVNKISLQMLKFIKDSKSMTDTLSTTSMKLQNSVSRFKLPEREDIESEDSAVEKETV
ncbi:MAG: hypothetical protein BV458_14125 [Thermoplasmata archaeon M9B2D]|nr:MAG: hypothetical protein BV458_14125 [Thermoplasmata archaeon M9B2D]